MLSLIIVAVVMLSQGVSAERPSEAHLDAAIKAAVSARAYDRSVLLERNHRKAESRQSRGATFSEKVVKARQELLKSIHKAEIRVTNHEQLNVRWAEELVDTTQNFLRAQLERGGGKLRTFLATNPSEDAIAEKKADIGERIAKATAVLNKAVNKAILNMTRTCQESEAQYAREISAAKLWLDTKKEELQRHLIVSYTVARKRIDQSLLYRAEVLLESQAKEPILKARQRVLEILGLEADEESYKWTETVSASQAAGRKAMDEYQNVMIAKTAYKNNAEFRDFATAYALKSNSEMPNVPRSSSQLSAKTANRNLEIGAHGDIRGVVEGHGSASGSANLLAGQANFAAEGALFLGVRANGNAHAKIGDLEARAEGMVEAGVSARGSAEGSLDLKAGTLQIGAEGSAFAGAKAEGSAQVSMTDIGTVEAIGAVGVGIGLQGTARAGCRKGKCKAKLSLGLFCGIGGQVSLSITVDFKGLLRKATQVVKNALREFAEMLEELTGDDDGEEEEGTEDAEVAAHLSDAQSGT